MFVYLYCMLYIKSQLAWILLHSPIDYFCISIDDPDEVYIPKNQIALDPGVTEDFEMTLISEVAILRDKFEVVQFLQHFPSPQCYSGQYSVSLWQLTQLALVAIWDWHLVLNALWSMFLLQHPLYIVLDTSALLTHLEMVTKYMKTPVEGVGQTVFLFPWEVLQELDILMGHENPDILSTVKKAVEFLHDIIVSQNPRVLFQVFEEVCL